MEPPKSKTGWLFALLYLGFASFLVYLAFTCIGWVCDIVEFPAAIPFGLLYLGLLRLLDPILAFGSITYSPFRNWFFIVPTLIGNAIVFYWLGVSIEKLWRRAFRRGSTSPSCRS